MRVVAPDGIETVLRCKGPGGGAGVILIHGILHCSLVWKHQFADEALSGIRVAAYDIRGHGAAGKPAGPEFYQPERFAGELDAVIRASGIHRPVIVGWSLGTRMTFNYLAELRRRRGRRLRDRRSPCQAGTEQPGCRPERDRAELCGRPGGPVAGAARLRARLLRRAAFARGHGRDRGLRHAGPSRCPASIRGTADGLRSPARRPSDPGSGAPWRA